MTEEQQRLSELRAMEVSDIGAVSLLAYETMAQSKMNYFRRMCALKTALKQIEANPANAQRIAVAALDADIASM